MTRSTCFKSTLLATALTLFVLPAAQAANMGKAEYETAKTTVGDTYKADKVGCAALKSNAKDVCTEQAKAKEKAARADLEFGYSGKAEDATKARIVKAEGAYAVAKERCDDLAGNDKDVCVKQAKAVETKAVSDAKLGREVAEARKDAAGDVADANYKLAAEKCEALASDAKASCIGAAKAKFNKS